MVSIIMLSLLTVATFVVLCYLFNESRIELDSPTIAAMEARTKAIETGPKHDQDTSTESAPAPRNEDTDIQSNENPINSAAPVEPPPPIEVASYEYREMLEEGGENYVLPQWMLNFFSSSDICHTLDPSDNMLIIAKLNDTRNAETGIVDISVDCDMGTQTVALKFCFGEGAAAETFRTKFYLFERGDLFELGRLARQAEIRIDVLTRAADYTLEYACTMHSGLSQDLLTQLNEVLAKFPT